MKSDSNEYLMYFIIAGHEIPREFSHIQMAWLVNEAEQGGSRTVVSCGPRNTFSEASWVTSLQEAVPQHNHLSEWGISSFDSLCAKDILL